MDWLHFWLGAAGSAVIEVVVCLKYYYAGRPLPRRYRLVGFWVLRTILALAAGGLVWVHRIQDNPLLALNIGASAPAILLSFGQGISAKASSSREASRRGSKAA